MSEGGSLGAEAPAERSTNRAAAVIGLGILLSRISGLVRTIAIGAFLAVGVQADAFFAAFKIPNILQNLLGEGVLSASFIPVHSQLVDDDKERAGRVAGAIAGLLLLVTAVLVLIGVVAARPLTRAINPGFEGERLDLAVDLVRIMTPGVGVLVLSSWCLGILNANREFFLSYVSPVLWNAFQIGAVLTAGLAGLAKTSIVTALAWGVVGGGVAQFLVQLPRVRKLTPGLRIGLGRGLPEVAEIMRRAVPTILARGVVQISALVDSALASLLVIGAPAMLGFTQLLYILPVSLFGMSIAAAELPEMSRAHERADVLERRLTDGLRRSAFFVVFTAVAYLIAGQGIVGVLFERGKWNADQTMAVWLTLAAFSIGLPAATLSRLWQSTLYAVGDVKVPALISLVRVIAAAGLGAMLMLTFDELLVADGMVSGFDRFFNEPLRRQPDIIRNNPNLPHLGAMGLGFASAVASWTQLWLLARRARSLLGLKTQTPDALLLMAPGALLSAGVMLFLLLFTGRLPLLLRTPLVVGIGGLVYLAVSHLANVPEARQLVARLSSLARR